jgi:hypothetical protein
MCRSQWPRGVRRGSAAARMLRLWVRTPQGAWKIVCFECYVLSGTGLCDELITLQEESYRLWCVVVCEHMLLLKSCLQTCMTYTIAECTVNKLLMMDRGTYETCRVSCQNKFVKFVYLVGFIIKELQKLGHQRGYSKITQLF